MAISCTFVVKMYHTFKVSNWLVCVTSGGYHNVRRTISEDSRSDTANSAAARVFSRLTTALLCWDYKVT